MSRQRIPHLLTRLLTESELDALNHEIRVRAFESTDPAVVATWLDASLLIETYRTKSIQRRAAQTPSARRKSLDSRISPTAHRSLITAH